MRKKQRPEAHLMEERSLQVLAAKLPAEWARHDYLPDYGIDLAVEIFERDKSGSVTTMGELFFAQVKSLKRCKIATIAAKARDNVEKSPISPAAPSEYDTTVECVKFVCDVPLLNTVLAMGAASVVILFLVTLEDEQVYFICLNDYIDKVLHPARPRFSEQHTVTLFIPTRNNLAKANGYAIDALRHYAKRSKQYAAFNLFAYQQRELIHRFSPTMAAHFLDRVMALDIWERPAGWHAPALTREHLSLAKQALSRHDWADDASNRRRFQMIWSQLTNLGAIYETIVRKGFLPTVLGQMP